MYGRRDPPTGPDASRRGSESAILNIHPSRQQHVTQPTPDVSESDSLQGSGPNSPSTKSLTPNSPRMPAAPMSRAIRDCSPAVRSLLATTQNAAHLLSRPGSRYFTISRSGFAFLYTPIYRERPRADTYSSKP